MILRPVLANSLVWSAPVDPACTFESGMIVGLMEISGELFVSVADGKNISPIGIVDDDKTSAFSGAQTDEVVIVPAPFQNQGGILISTMDVMGGLQEVNIVQSSFSTNLDIILNPKKGTFIIPAGTPLNYQEGNIYGFEVICSYRYTIADYPGNDTTDGSGQVAIHFQRGIFTTNIFDTLSTYYPGCPLYCSCEGILTSQENGPMIGLALQPSSAVNNELLFMWL